MSAIDKYNARYGNRKKKTETSQPSSQPTKDSKAFEKMKQTLQSLGFSIQDETAFKQIIEEKKINSIKADLIEMLKGQGIITSTENPPKQNNSETSKKSSGTVRINEETETPPPPKNTREKLAETQNKIKELLSKRERSEKSTPLDKTIELEKFPESMEKWCTTNVNKKDNKPKHKINISKQETNEINITITPLSSGAQKQSGIGAVYAIKKTPNPQKLDVTLKSSEPGKTLSYDYFYALVKAAKESGADTIEFNNIRTPEFRDKLLAASLQFKMKIKNPPGIINLEAKHLQFIPQGCRQYLENHNSALKKVMEEKRKALEARKQQTSTQQRAEDRPLSEQKRIEAMREEKKFKRAEAVLKKIKNEKSSKR